MIRSLILMERGWIKIIRGLKGGLVLALLSQPASRSRVESNSIDFSQSLSQILSSLGHNLNENPREGFAIVSVCTDTWKDTMISRNKNQKERILTLEHNV